MEFNMNLFILMWQKSWQWKHLYLDQCYFLIELVAKKWHHYVHGNVAKLKFRQTFATLPIVYEGDLERQNILGLNNVVASLIECPYNDLPCWWHGWLSCRESITNKCICVNNLCVNVLQGSCLMMVIIVVFKHMVLLTFETPRS
jgi:hypothetical protein